ILLHDVIPIVRPFLRSAGKFLVAQLIPLRTFSRAISKHFIARCDSHSTTVFEVYWQVFGYAAHSSLYVFSGHR
ncbi:hypothetical protein PanWU01x14_169280, partial [Parasponia andersonii]